MQVRLAAGAGGEQQEQPRHGAAGPGAGGWWHRAAFARRRAFARGDRRLLAITPTEGRTLELTEGGTALLVVGLALVALGAVGATVVSRHAEWMGSATTLPLRLVPFGVLVGAGASLVRGWDLGVSMLAGAVLVPAVGAVGRWLEVRRSRGRG